MAYSDVVLADSPAVYLQMQETSGTTATDSSGNARDGTYVGGAVVNDTTDMVAPVNLTANKHVRLDGSDDYIRLATPGSWFVPGTAGYSFEGWFFVRAWNRWNRMFDFANASNVVDISLDYDVWTGPYKLNLHNGSNILAFDPWPINTWTHLVVTVTAAGAAIAYVNEVAVASGSITALATTTRDRMFVGRSADDANIAASNMSCCHVAVYNLVLSPARVSVHYQTGKNPTTITLASELLEVAVAGVPQVRMASQSFDVVVVPTPVVRMASQLYEVMVGAPVAVPAAPTSYTNMVLADTPKGYWRLEEPDVVFTVLDYSGNNFHGTRAGGTAVSASPVDGGQAYQFADNTVDRITIGNGAVLGTGFAALTVECWFKASNPSTMRALVGNDNAGTPGPTRNWGLNLLSNGSLQGIVFSGSSYSEAITSTGFGNNQWHHAVLVYDGTKAYVYLDGALAGTGAALTGTVNASTGSSLRIASFADDKALPGVIDEVAVYDTALSAIQIRTHAWGVITPENYIAAVMADSPIMYLKMQETSGTTAFDFSTGGAHAGIYTNGAALNDTTDPAPPGILSKHVRLDGTNDYVDLAGGSWFNPSAGYTVEGWFYTRGWNNFHRFFDFANAANTGDILLLSDNNASDVRLDTNGGLFHVPRWPLNVWTHVVCTVAPGGAAKVYVNGAQYSGTVGSPTAGNRQFMYLGRSNYAADAYLAGSMCHVALYHTVLSATRVRVHYLSGLRAPLGPSTSVWNGTTAVPATVTVWNGTTEVAAHSEIAP